MTVAAASDERKVCISKKSGSSASNWALTDDSAPGAGDAVYTIGPVRPERDITPLEDEAMGGEYAQGETLNGGVKCTPSLETYLHYQATAEHLPFAMCLGGSGGAPSTPGGGTLSRDQYFEHELNINGIVATICEGATASRTADQPSASIVPSAMFKGFTISGEGDGLITCKSDVVGIDAFLKPAPTDDPLPSGLSLNATLANIAASTCLSTGRRLRMGDLELLMDDADGAEDFSGAQREDYVIPVGRFEISFQRDLSYPDYGSQPANALDGVSRPMMPVNSKQHVIPTISFQLKRWEDDEIFGEMVARTPKRIRLEFTGALIEGSLYQRFRIDLPKVLLKTAGRDKAQGNIMRTVTGACYKAASTPTGFNSTVPIRFDVRNQVTSDIMA